MVTVKDVAESAGVSIASVSRVFKDSNLGTREMRKRVLGAAQNLGYIHTGYRSKNSNRTDATTGTIALLSSAKIGTAGDTSIFHGIIPVAHKEIEDKGFHLILSSYSPDDLSVPSILQKQRVNGVILLSESRVEFITRIEKFCPVVLLNNVVEWPPITCVAPNNNMIFFKALNCLKELGHKRIAYFGVTEESQRERYNSVHVKERKKSYLEAMQRLGLENSLELLLAEDFSEGGHHEVIHKVLDKILAYKQPPTAIVTTLPYAVSFVCQLQKRQIRVPEDISILSIDDSAMAEQMNPPLTTVSSRFDLCMIESVRLLLARLENPAKFAKIIRMEPELIVRCSTGKASSIE